MDEELILSKFGARVRNARLALGLSQEKLALECGLDRTYISSVERGKRNVSLINIHTGILVLTSGLRVAYALTGAKTDERDTALDMIALAGLDRPGQTLLADKGYRRASFESELNAAHIVLIRPALSTEAPRPGRRALRAFRQIIESVNQTLKAQLDLERHGARTKPGVAARVLQRLLALTAAIWHNETTKRPGPARSLIAYDH